MNETEKQTLEITAMKAWKSLVLVPGLAAACLIGSMMRSSATAETNALLSTLSGPGLTATLPLDAPALLQVDLSPQAPPSPQTPLSPWALEIEKLAQAGIDDDVVLSFVDNTEGTFNLDAGEIICLKQAGVSSDVLGAMIQHDSDVTLGFKPLVASTVPATSGSLQISFGVAADALGNGSSPSDAGSSAPGEPESILAPDSETGPSIVDVSASGYDFGGLHASEAALISQSAGGEQELYPVRKPYPVEITGPTLLVHGWSKRPNVLVIQFNP